jgi:uracil-DNA glycosylase
MTVLDLFGPAESLNEAAQTAKTCRRCDLYRNAKQTVFGEGPPDAAVMFVGEQPGDKEDIAGRPFVGPAGQLFDKLLAEAGIDRSRCYVTNAVKHFKNEPRGRIRLHKKPTMGEVTACRWWLDQERALIKPRLIVALGATAAQSLLGRAVTVSKIRGERINLDDGSKMIVTVHPSYLLRIPDEPVKRAETGRFLADLRAVAETVPEIRVAA